MNRLTAPENDVPCPACGLPTVGAAEVIAGCARYGDSQGGHNDRHTLVIEAAERLIPPGS